MQTFKGEIFTFVVARILSILNYNIWLSYVRKKRATFPVHVFSFTV